MNGAQSLIMTLANNGLELCLANPGTSEMHLVAALDQAPNVRPVLVLFEGVATGAADGYARMTDRPAATLLHLGPGLSNGLANLHNARRAGSPLLNIVGDHATYHRPYDTPLTSDIATLAGPISGWVGAATDAGSLPALGLEAFRASLVGGGQVATLIVPADCAWGESGPALTAAPPPAAAQADPNVIVELARLLQGSGPATAILLGQKVLREKGLEAAARIVAVTGATVLADTVTTRVERGAGRVAFDRLPYLGRAAYEALAGFKHLITVTTRPPATFFAYQGHPSSLVPEGCQVHALAEPGQDGMAALAALAAEIGGVARPEPEAFGLPDLPSGRLDADKAGAIVARLLPEGAIISEEATTSGLGAWRYTMTARPHDWLFLTGGSIGQGLPLATGAALACPDRPVVCLSGDGGAMYTIQALWTQAREGLNVVNVIFSNRKYAILQIELFRMGLPGLGARTRDLFDLTRPEIDFTALARGMGVPGRRADTAEDFTAALERGLAEPGPCLIEAIIA
jgi:acetolactate synthase-1/2/3 large subunit